MEICLLFQNSTMPEIDKVKLIVNDDNVIKDQKVEEMSAISSAKGDPKILGRKPCFSDRF